MAEVRLESVTVRRGGDEVLHNVDLVAIDHEMLVIVGRSGAGKSVLLRVVAGLERPAHGRVFIGDRDVTPYDAADRNVAMVFQNNALYPFLDVRRNVSFPLEVRRTSRDEIDARVLAETRVLAIEHLLERMPRELSAGQQQLVQAARAFVRAPDVFLMDEPLARLDAHHRLLIRHELRLLQTGYGVTTMYVTNDPEEAMATADRIAVIDQGWIVQVGLPLEIYHRPASHVVASVASSPPIEFVRGRVVADPPGSWVEVGPLRVRAWDPGLAAPAERVDVGLRPEHVEVDDEDGVPGVVVRSELLGMWSRLGVEVAPGLVVPSRVDTPMRVGEPIRVKLVGAHVFDPVNGVALGHVPSAVS